jgi:hypothetical protein
LAWCLHRNFSSNRETMKPLRSFLFIALLLSGWATSAQSDITASVTDAFKRGDASSLSQYFMSPLDLTIDDLDGAFSKEDAKLKVSAFFSQHTPKDLVIKHQGTSKVDDQFRIGDLTTAQGTYRVTFFMRKSGNAMLIKQLKIEAL